MASARQASTIEKLRRKISAIERRYVLSENDADQSRGAHAWITGAAEIDAHIGIRGLEIGAVHEIKPDLSGGWLSAAAKASAEAFMLALVSRRLATQHAPEAIRLLNSGSAGRSRRGQPNILACRSSYSEVEHGRLHGPGLSVFGIDPERLIIVTTKREDDVLWALEEGLRSSSLSIVIGQVDDVSLTPARRLALAAAETQTPCLILTHAKSPSIGATATRWRVSPDATAPHPLVAGCPGALRFKASLERCRSAPPLSTDRCFTLEWCDETLCLHMASELSNRAPEANKSHGTKRRILSGAA